MNQAERTVRLGRGGTIAQNGSVMRELRIRRKLHLSEAAPLIGCDQRYLGKLELERRNASDIMIQKIADFYGVSPDEIRKPEVAKAA